MGEQLQTVGLASGINEWGLALGAQSVGPPKDGSSRFNPTGIASAVAGRRLMEDCRDVDAVNLWLKENRLVRSVSIASCDPKRHVVFEVTTSRVLTRSDDGGVCCATNHFRVAALASNTGCSRYSELEALKKSNRLDLSVIKNALHAVNQGKMTVHSMVFEPKHKRIHLAMGPGPATGKPYATIDLAEYFRRN